MRPTGGKVSANSDFGAALWYGPRPLHASARQLAPCVAAFVLSTTTGLALGATGGSGELSSLEASERAASVELFASEVALARARADLERHTRRESTLAARRERLSARAEIVRGSLRATHARIGTLLRMLYVEGETDPIQVVLGARSLDAVLEGVDGLERAARRNRVLAAEAREKAQALDKQLVRLAHARAALAATRSQLEASAAHLADATAQKRSTLATLQRRKDVTAARIASDAREAELAAARVDTTPAATPVAADGTSQAPSSPAGPPEPGGARTLVVDAVAYHLPGRTASGLPVGVGVIAVDPGVIPLGTRVFVPGYGPAVAADTGSAIRGNIIDLWMPSTAAARAWGRRTVTITIYR